mmetsp:Transcript_6596/g.11933  ORF Transcript_6596/g.11933 Transcript_6596/m.11933 type:complete len:103 (-) Transcript_6596:9-317(-)
MIKVPNHDQQSRAVMCTEKVNSTFAKPNLAIQTMAAISAPTTHCVALQQDILESDSDANDSLVKIQSSEDRTGRSRSRDEVAKRPSRRRNHAPVVFRIQFKP